MAKKDRKNKHEKKDKEKKSKGKQGRSNDIANKHKKGRGKGRTKQDKNWDKYFAEFNEALKPRGIYMRDVEGDGNCLFRSIAEFLEGDESIHAKYRDMAVEYITKNKDYFGMFLEEDENMDEYIKDMSESGTWGGHFELVALSSELEVKFVLYMKDKDPVLIKSSEKEKKNMKVVHLAYHVDQHYSCIRKIGDDDKGPAEDIPLPDMGSDSSSESSSDEDSTEESDKEVNKLAKEVENLHVKDKKNKGKGKGKEKEEDNRGKKKGKKNFVSA